MPQRYIVVAEEASYAPATPVTPDQYIAANRASANMEENAMFPTSPRGRSFYEMREGYYSENVTFQIDVRPDNKLGWLLKWLLGNVSSSQQGATSAYLHTFKSSDLIRSFAFGYNWDTLVEKRVPGCIMQNVKFAISRGGTPLTADVTAIGQDESLVAVQSPTYSSLAPFKPYHATVDIASSELVNLAEGITINIANKIYDIGEIGVLGTRKLPRIELGERAITGTLDIPLTSGTIDLYKRYLGKSGEASPYAPVEQFAIDLNIDTGIEADTGYNYLLNFNMPKCTFTSAPVNIEKQERKRISLGFKAIYDSGIASDIKVELQNTTTEYADAT